MPNWQLQFERERELQAVAAARVLEELAGGFDTHVVLAGDLTADPDAARRPIRPPKKRGVERTTFSRDQEKAIFANNDRRDCLSLHL
jgi:hypothetical protein